MSVFEVEGSKKPIPKIAGVKPTGGRILVEMFSPQESMGTNLIVGDGIKVPVHQGYVRGLGPHVPKDFGISLGDRVWIDGAIVYAPEFGPRSDRKIGTIEFSMVKGVIQEAAE